MSKGSGTRSGLLWEIERILNELNELGRLPEYLLLENVKTIKAASSALGPMKQYLSRVTCVIVYFHNLNDRFGTPCFINQQHRN